jgi:hypothetical protein
LFYVARIKEQAGSAFASVCLFRAIYSLSCLWVFVEIIWLNLKKILFDWASSHPKIFDLSCGNKGLLSDKATRNIPSHCIVTTFLRYRIPQVGENANDQTSGGPHWRIEVNAAR